MKFPPAVSLWSALYVLLLCSCYADDEEAQLEAGIDATLDFALHRSLEGGSFVDASRNNDATSGAIPRWFEDAAVRESGQDTFAEMDADVEGRKTRTSDAASPAFEDVMVSGPGEDSGVETDADRDDKDSAAGPSSDCVSREEYEVYSEVIRQHRLGSSDLEKVVAIYDTVGFDESSDWFEEDILSFEDEIRGIARLFEHDIGCCIDDLVAAQRRRCYLSKESFSISDRITLIGGDTPFGTSGFSRVGFDKDGRRAIVAHDLMAAPLAGSGLLIYLEKVDAEWIIREERLRWIS